MNQRTQCRIWPKRAWLPGRAELSVSPTLPQARRRASMPDTSNMFESDSRDRLASRRTSLSCAAPCPLRS